MKNLRIVMTCLVVILLGSTGLADVPSLINYQGVLTDPATGDLLDGTYEMDFSIYGGAEGGTALWTETQSVDVEMGEFSVLLGSVNPVTSAVFSADERYLGIAVGGDSEMTPRKVLACVPYSFVSDRTQQVDWSDIDNVPAGFADGVDDAGGTAADDAGREGVVGTLYEGSSSLEERYLRIFNYNSYDNSGWPGDPWYPDYKYGDSSPIDIYFGPNEVPAVKVQALGPGPVMTLATHAGHALKISGTDNPLLKMWCGDPTAEEPEDKGFMMELHSDFPGKNSGINVYNNVAGYCFKGQTYEGTAVEGKSDVGIGIHGISSSGTGDPPSIGVKGEGVHYGGYFVGTAGGAAGARFQGSPAAIFDGDIKLNGDISREYSAGSYSMATPIAYATIHQNGSVNEGTPNVSSTWSEINDRYEITIAGENYGFRDYVTVVTPATSAPYLARTGSVGGRLLIYIYNLSGDMVQSDFHFVIFKP